MTDQSVSGDVLFQDIDSSGKRDSLDQTNLSRVAGKSNLSDYVERGFELTYDSGDNTLDIKAGSAARNHAVVRDGADAYDVFPDDKTGLELPTSSGVAYVYLAVRPGTYDDIYYHIDTADDAPSDPALKIAEVDTGAGTTTAVNRDPATTHRSVDADRVHTDRRNADVVIAKRSGSIEVDGPDGDISFTGEILDAVKAAIDAAPASNGWHIHIAPGQYDITGTYSDGFQLDFSKDGITISGAGYSTHLRVKDNTTDSSEGIRLITWTGSGVTIKNIRIDGNQNNNGGSLDGSTTNISGTSDGMNIRPRGDDFEIRGIWSVRATGDGVEPHADSNSNTKNGTIENCIFKDNYEQHIHFGGCENVTVDNCILINEIRNAAVNTVAVEGTTTKACKLSDCIIRSGQQEAVKITPGSGTVEDFEVKDNIIIGPANECVLITGESANYDDAPHDIRVKDNTLRGGLRGVQIVTGSKIRVTDNEIIRNDENGVVVDALVGDPISDVKINDNDINNNGVVTESNAVFVRNRDQTVSQVRVWDNDILVTDSDAGHTRGLHFVDDTGSFSKVLFGSNHVDGFSAAVPVGNAVDVGRFKDTATIQSGSTSVVVNHNLGKDVAPNRVQVTPLGSLGSASEYYVDDANISSTSFTINVDTDPAQDVRFSWWIRKEA